MPSERKRKILITHLGGTIGMVRDTEPPTLRSPENAKEFEKSAKDIIRVFETKHPDVKVELACLSTVDSNDINPELIEEYVAYIRAREHEFDAIVMTHGTDTESSTLSAISLAFININKSGSLPINTIPIVGTGSQTSSFDEPQDASRNLTNALFAAERLCRDRYYQCVVQVFGSRILDAPYSVKVDESGDDAFDAVDDRGRIGKCSSAKGTVFNETFLRNCHSLSLQERQAQLDYSNALGNTLPSGRFLIAPLKEVRAGTSRVAVPLDNGHYIHLAKARTLGHPHSISLQAKDRKCLGVVFELTGIGNAPYLYCDGISEAIRERGVPVYGSLNISGGLAQQNSYEAGMRLREAGVITGNDASADHTFISMQWALANLRPNISTTEFLTILQAGHHLNWDNGESSSTSGMGEMPAIFKEAAEGENSFTSQHAFMQSRINSYRDWKYQNRLLRWINVEDPNLKDRVIEHLPRADKGLIVPPHRDETGIVSNGWNDLLLKR